MCSPLRASTAMPPMWRSPATGRASRFAMAATTSPINRMLVRTLSRERAKDMATDYGEADPISAFAERRGITFGERIAEIVREAPRMARGMFDGLRRAMTQPARSAGAFDPGRASDAPEPQRGVFASFRAQAPAVDRAEERVGPEVR